MRGFSRFFINLRSTDFQNRKRTPFLQFGCYHQEGEAAEELVGGAEERPKEQSAGAGRFARGAGKGSDQGGKDDREDGGGVFVGKRLDAGGRGELLGDVALQSAGAVEGGGGEGGDEDAHQRDGELGRKTEGLDEVAGPIDEGTDFGGEAAGALPGGVAGVVGVGAGEGCAGFLPVDHFRNPETDTGDAGKDHEHGEESFGEHRAVADELGVGLGLELLRRGAGGDQAVEAGDRAAGDGDEEEGKDDRGAGWSVLADTDRLGGDLEGDLFLSTAEAEEGGDEQSEDDQREGGEELERVDVVARLEQHPDGKHRGNIRVEQQHDAPGDDRPGGEGGIEGVEGSPIAEGNAGIHDAEGDQRGQHEVDALAVEPEADDDGDRDLDQAGEDRGREHLEDRGNDQAEDGEHNGQGDEQDGEEQDAGARGEDAAGDVADGLAAVTHRNDQRAEVVDRADQDRAEQHPQQRRDPAPDDGESGADDRSSAGDRGEVVAEDDAFGGRDVVVAVLEFDRGRDTVGIELEDPACQPAAVGVVGDQVEHERSERDGECRHGFSKVCRVRGEVSRLKRVSAGHPGL